MSSDQSMIFGSSCGKQSNLQPNVTKEMGTACSYYFGEEQFVPMQNMPIRINPVFDMIAAQNDKPANYCYDIEDLLKQGKEQ